MTTLELREGFVTDEFIDLARTDPRSADQERRLDVLKREMAERVMARPAAEVYDGGSLTGPPGRELPHTPGGIPIWALRPS